MLSKDKIKDIAIRLNDAVNSELKNRRSKIRFGVCVMYIDDSVHIVGDWVQIYRRNNGGFPSISRHILSYEDKFEDEISTIHFLTDMYRQLLV